MKPYLPALSAAAIVPVFAGAAAYVLIASGQLVSLSVFLPG